MNQSDFKNYKEYVDSLSKNEITQILSCLDRDKYPERYDMALQAYKSAIPDNSNTPNLSEEIASFEKGPIGKAIFAGSFIDIIGGLASEFLIPFIVTVIYSLLLYRKGLDPNTIESRLLALLETPYYSVLMIAAISFVPFMAGYVSAKIAKGNAIQSTIIVGVLTSMVGLIFGANANIDDALAQSLFRNIVSFIFILMGGFTWIFLKIGKGKTRQQDV